MSESRQKPPLGRRIALLTLILICGAIGVSYVVIRVKESAKREREAQSRAKESAKAEMESRKLAKEALKHIEDQLDLGLLLSVEALKKAKTEEARESLLMSLRRPYPAFYLRGHEDEVMSVAFSPDGALLASGSADGAVRLWNVERTQAVSLPDSSHRNSVRDVAFHPDGSVLASGATDGTIIFWDISRRLPIGAPLKADRGVFSLAYSPNGKILASGQRDFRVSLWDVSKREKTCPAFTGHRERVHGLAFSPDGETLASASWKILLWDVANCRSSSPPLSKHKGVLTSLAFSPDGNILASGSILDDTVMLWDFGSRESLGGPLVHRSGISSVAFSPDGKTLAAGCADGTIYLWDVESRQPLGPPLKGHQDSTFVLTEPKFIGDELGTLRPERKKSEALVRSVAFSPDGKILASGGADFNIILWDVEHPSLSAQNSELIIHACRRANRNLSRNEWKTYLPSEAYRKTCPEAPTHPDFVEVYEK